MRLEKFMFDKISYSKSFKLFFAKARKYLTQLQFLRRHFRVKEHDVPSYWRN